MLAYAGPSWPHTCVSGLPGHGGWGGQRSPSWATATGPGLFRSFGYWLLRRSTYSHTRGGKAGRRRGACMWCGCVCCTAVLWGGSCYTGEGRCSNGSAPGACREGGGSIPAGAVGSVGSPTDPFEYRTGPPVDPPEYRWRRALLQVCVVPVCPFFWGGVAGGKTDETSTLSAGTGGGAGCCRGGGGFQRCPLESSTCREPKSSSSRVSNPRTGRLKTTALAIGPSMSLTRNAVSFTYGAFRGGGGVGGASCALWCVKQRAHTVSPPCCT